MLRIREPFGKSTIARVANSLLVLLIIAVMSLLVISCSQKNESTKVTIAQTGDFFLYAPIYLALDAGFFGQAGLDVTIVSTGGDEKSWAAVLSGSASFAVSDPTFIAVSADKGVPGKIVASIVNGVPFWGITYDSISAFSSSGDLSGHVVGTFPSPSTAYTLQKKMFEDAGLEPNIREGAFGTIIAMLKSGEVDIGLELEPNVSQAIQNGARLVYSMAPIYGDFAITGLTTTPKIIEEQSGVVEGIVCSIQKAMLFAREQQDSALVLLSKRFPEIHATVARNAFQRVIDEGIIPATPVLSDEAWNSAIQVRVEVGDVEELQPSSTYVDNRFALSAENNCKVNE